MDNIAVLIPCYNEAQTIRKVVTDWKKELPEAVIYVYDNNSTDNTAVIAEEAGAIVRHEYMQGKGNVIRRMFREIDAKAYIMVDGDDTYPAEYGRKIVKERIEGGANEKAVLRLFINCPFVCINFDFFWLNKARQLYMDF